MNTDRVIIGETERAGWPISAPKIDDNDLSIEGTVRWSERDGHFVLEQFRQFKGWCEVGCQTRKAIDE